MREQPHESLDQRLATNMRRIREASNMTQVELAAAMSERGIPWHQQTVGRIEAGQQQLRAAELIQVAAILGVSLDQLTWSSPEVIAMDWVYAAGTAVRHSYDEIAEAIMQGLANVNRAKQVLADSADNPSPRVQEVRETTADRLKKFGVNEAIEEGLRRHNQLPGKTEKTDKAADE